MSNFDSDNPANNTRLDPQKKFNNFVVEDGLLKKVKVLGKIEDMVKIVGEYPVVLSRSPTRGSSGMEGDVQSHYEQILRHQDRWTHTRLLSQYGEWQTHNRLLVPHDDRCNNGFGNQSCSCQKESQRRHRRDHHTTGIQMCNAYKQHTRPHAVQQYRLSYAHHSSNQHVSLHLPHGSCRPNGNHLSQSTRSCQRSLKRDRLWWRSSNVSLPH